jgi:O-antigen ligase
LTLDRAQLVLVAGVVATCQVSIFGAQVLLTAALVVYAVRLAFGRTSWPRLPLDGPTLAFGVWTLLSAAFSTNPVLSDQSAKKLVLFFLLYVTVDSAGSLRRREQIVDAALLGSLLLGGGALVQYFLLGFDTLVTRPTSFLGHYMTASGLSMLGLVLAAARLVLSRSRASTPSWPPPALRTALAAATFAVSTWALLISRTRNAWLGAMAGLAVVGILRAPKTLWLLATGLVLIVVVRPAPLMDRLTLTDASSVDRYYMWQAGIDMIRDRPVFGQGPGMILSRYPVYRWAEAPNAQAPHLHDNALQIAAERGLPCLAFWLWWMAAAMGDAFREWRRGAAGAAWTAAATLGVLTSMMVAGLFEYNFGDSEVFMFVLVVTAFPYALRRERQVTIATP